MCLCVFSVPLLANLMMDPLVPLLKSVGGNSSLCPFCCVIVCWCVGLSLQSFSCRKSSSSELEFAS